MSQSLPRKVLNQASEPCLTKRVQVQGDYVVLASEPVCICGVDVAAPQQLRVRNSQQKMSMAELRSIFSRQFTEYEVGQAFSRPAPPPAPGSVSCFSPPLPSCASLGLPAEAVLPF